MKQQRHAKTGKSAHWYWVILMIVVITCSATPRLYAQQACGDFNNDGVLDVFDYMILAQYLNCHTGVFWDIPSGGIPCDSNHLVAKARPCVPLNDSLDAYVGEHGDLDGDIGIDRDDIWALVRVIFCGSSPNSLVCGPTVWITVQDVSNSGGVPIQIAPDLRGNSRGTTPFYREYDCPNEVTLIAPPEFGYNTFMSWKVRGLTHGVWVPIAIPDSSQATLTLHLGGGPSGCSYSQIVAVARYRTFAQCDVQVQFGYGGSVRTYDRITDRGVEHVIERQVDELGTLDAGVIIHFKLPPADSCPGGAGGIRQIYIIPEHGTGLRFPLLDTWKNEDWQTYFEIGYPYGQTSDFYDLEVTYADGSVHILETNINYRGYVDYSSQGAVKNLLTGNAVTGATVYLTRYTGVGWDLVDGQLAKDGAYDFGSQATGTYKVCIYPMSFWSHTCSPPFDVHSPLPYQEIFINPLIDDILPPVVSATRSEVDGHDRVDGVFTDSPAGISVLNVVAGTRRNAQLFAGVFEPGDTEARFRVMQENPNGPWSVTLSCVDQLGNRTEYDLASARADSGKIQIAVSVGGTSSAVGIGLDVYDAADSLVSELVTGLDGKCETSKLIRGEYEVVILPPLGYLPDAEAKTVVLDGDSVMVAFGLHAAPLSHSPRGLGYWKHQVRVALDEKGKAQESINQLSAYMNTMRAHFNDNRLNSVDVFQVPQPATKTDSLMVLSALLSGQGGSDGTGGVEESNALKHVTALLLNVASGKLSQPAVISEDGMTVSHAITYCNALVTDPDPSNDEVAKNIAETINEGQILLAGMIPPDVMSILYRTLDGSPALPKEFALEQNYPNPFNAGTQISYSLSQETQLKLEVFDVLGQHVVTLVDEIQTAGMHNIDWNGGNSAGEAVASGMYFYRLTAAGRTESRRMVLLK